MKNAASVKDRLRNYAQKSGRTFQDILTMYVLERVLYRMSKSEYANHFTLKGGIWLYGMYRDNFSRATTDMDLPGAAIPNSGEHLKRVFRDILSEETDDPMKTGTRLWIK